MADTWLDDMMTPLTEDQVFETFLSVCRELELPVDSWAKGGALRVILRVVARVYAGFTAIMAAFIKSGFLDTAEKEWLTRLAKYVYGVTRREATFARETITLTNDGGFLFEQAAGTVTVVNPTTKKAYVNVEAFVLDPLGTADVTFEALEIGSASSAAVNTITELETNLADVRVTNPRPFIAIDAETDPEVRQACRDKLGALSVRGPRGAYAYAIREARRDDGNPVNVNRRRLSTSSSTGKVFVWAASPSGAPVAEDITAIESSVEQRARPDGVRVYVAGASEVPLSKVLTVYATRTDGVSARDIKALVESTFVREGATFPIGGMRKPGHLHGYVFADWISARAIGSHPSIFDVDGAGDDEQLEQDQVPVMAITANVILVDSSEIAA